jgi:hypothetical protein
MKAQQISCRDVSRRDRASTVAIDGGEAVLTVPPGEVARYSGPELTKLIEALRAARDELFRSGSS